MSGIVHFGASNYLLAFLAHERSASAYAAVRAAVGFSGGREVNAILVMVSIIVSICKQYKINKCRMEAYYIKLGLSTFTLKVRGSDISALCIFFNSPDFDVSFKFIDETHWDEKGVEWSEVEIRDS